MEMWDKKMLRLGAFVAIVVGITLSASYVMFHLNVGRWGWYTLALSLALATITTLFGILALPGARNEDGGYREERIRFAVVATLLLVYLILFSQAVFWNEGYVNRQMLETLTNMMTIVLPFYFGTSGVVEWAKGRTAASNEAQEKRGKTTSNVT